MMIEPSEQMVLIESVVQVIQQQHAVCTVVSFAGVALKSSSFLNMRRLAIGGLLLDDRLSEVLRLWQRAAASSKYLCVKRSRALHLL